MDLLYGEEAEDRASQGLLKMDSNEDSVDIYAGLGDTPTHTTETPSMLFSPRVKESMDLYEEILTEEIKDKDSSYEELKARFLAAQNQIEELRKRLAQTETQNTGLSTENFRLKKNISALLKTARQEVFRKDEEIKRLNQRSGTNTYNPRGNGQWRTNNHPNKPPPLLPPPQPGPGNASSAITPTCRTPATPAAATPPYPPPPQHRPSRTSSTTSTTCTPQTRRTSSTNSTHKSADTPTNPPPPQHRASRSSSSSSATTTCKTPAPPTQTALPSLPQPQPDKTPSSLLTTCKPSPPPPNPPPPKHRHRTSSASSISCRPPAPHTESPLPSPSQLGIVKKSSSVSSTSISSAPPTNTPLPPSLPLPEPIRTSSMISTSKAPPPPPPPPVEPLPPPPPPPPPPVLQPRPPSPQTEDACPESLPPPPPPPPPSERVRDGAAQRPDATCLEKRKSKQSANRLLKCSSRLDSEAMVKQQEVQSQSSGKSSPELPSEGSEVDTSKPSKHKEQEAKMQWEATDKRLKPSLEPNKDCDIDHRNRSHREEKESRRKHISHKLLKSSRSQEAEEQRRSERAKSPNSRGRERKQDVAKPAVSESNHNSAEPRVSRLRDSGREHRKDKHTDRTSERKPSSSSKDWRNSTTKQHADRFVESSKRKGDRVDSSGEDRRKIERRREDENERREKRSEKHRTGGGDPDRKRWKDEGRRKAESREGEKTSIKDLEKPSEEECNVPTGMECSKENSSNKKLSFMETLNLTLSPVKKPQTQNDGVPQEDGEDEEEDGEIRSKDDDDQPNLEEFLIIDELESSTNEIDYNKEKSTKPSSAFRTSTDEKCAIEDVEEDPSLTTIENRVVASEQQEILPVPSTSDCGLPEAEERIHTDRPTLKSPVVAQESIIISKAPGEKTQCPSPNNPVEMEELEMLKPHDVEMGSISEDCKCSSSQDNNHHHEKHSEVIESTEPIALDSCATILEHELHASPSTGPGDSEKLSNPCPLTIPVAAEVKETVSCLSPITSPVADEFKETVSGPCPITSPVSGEVNKTTSSPCPITSPVSAEVNKMVSISCPTTGETGSPVSGGVNKMGGQEGLQSPPNDHLKPPAPASMLDPTHERDIDHQESSPKGSDTVSSTISLEALPQGDISLPEAIYVLTHADDNSSSDGISPNEPSSSVSCVGVSKVSSTTEDMTLPGKRESVQERTPLKGYHRHRTTEKDEASAKLSSSVPMFYDEDSMMLMLKNLRSIPDVISPLRSPMGRAKRVLAHCTTTKPPYVKSLQKDFCSTPVVSKSMKLDLNTETKYPDSPLSPDPQPVKETLTEALTCLPVHTGGVSTSSSDLEEGEILSDSNEATANLTPPKRSNLTRPAKNNKPSSKSITAKQGSKERGLSSRDTSDTPSTPSPSSGKSRFKKVCPAGEQTTFTTVEKVMEALKKVRFHIRKKYMKLHKVFPKKSFYAMMDHFQQSFLEFVESAAFGEMSSEVGELKAKLRKLVMSVFSKVMNNGIVNRIFDLQATNLKQRLWDFVDVQLDYLFTDILLALNTFCKPTVTTTATKTEQEVINPGKNGKIYKKLPIITSPKKSRSPKQKCPVQTIQRRIKLYSAVPSKTGLGRGKDIRMERQNGDPEPNPPGGRFPPWGVPLTPEKSHCTSVLISHNNNTTQDRSDFEILTEQQASSLTFNLVRDTQMGEIFKCLMQGTDLLDTSVAAGDSTSWSLSTPKKSDCLPSDSLLSITSPSKLLSPSKFPSPGKFMTPTKFVTSPSTLITTWSGISPSKFCSPQPKLLHMPLNPAMFDESCLLELPSSSRPHAQRSFSLLAEDLAVSLTIPSPLKSDSHLSFLQLPRTMDMMSTPESVISAHFGEDALLDGEDAWEQQDLHLALDTDHSDSSSSTTSTISTTTTTTGDSSTPLFQFKPHLPMQAVVMERSNDHFIVKIRQSAVEAADVTITAVDDSLSQTLTEEVQDQGETAEPHALKPHAAGCVPRALFLEKSFKKEPSPPKPSPPHLPPPKETIPAAPDSSPVKTKAKVRVKEAPSRPLDSASSMDEMDISTASEGRLTIVEDTSGCSTLVREASGRLCRKRKVRQEKKPRAKRAKTEEERGGRKQKTPASASPKRREPRSSRQETSKGTPSPSKTPPSSLSAKNVVKKKGEVVVAWTREEDRVILLELKTKGASRETFAALSEKLNKSSAKIAERFSQLMKLFKKREKMDSSSP